MGSVAMAEVFAEHAHYVFRALRRLGVDEADVEDVCQEVFLVVHRRIAAFEGRSSLRTWIYGISVRCAARYRKRPYRRREQHDVQAPEPAIDAAQPSELEHKRALQLLDRVLLQLPVPQREVYVLYELEELSMPEVAAAIGCPLPTAYSRLHAARKRILAAFEATQPDRKVV